jgi:hypothetical protein
MGIMLKPFCLIPDDHDEDDILANNFIAFSFSARFYSVTPNQLWF